MIFLSSLREAKQSISPQRQELDYFVAALLAMTTTNTES